MGQFIDSLLFAARRSRGYGEKLAAGIAPDQFARKPRFNNAGGETVVNCNHPAFVFGHLSLYPARVLGFLGLDTSKAAAPAHYGDLFRAGVECKDDPEGTIYPKMAELMSMYLRSHDAAFEAIATLSDSAMAAPTTEEKLKANFPVTGHAVLFLLNNHATMHLGQISTWRRCMGLPGVM